MSQKMVTDFLSGMYPNSAWSRSGEFSVFDDIAADYSGLQDGLGLASRTNRGLLELSGSDRATWLQALTTNHVTTVDAGHGNYAFVCNVQGRIVIDAIVLNMKDAIWLEMDRAACEPANEHFKKFLIVEDVSITDRSDDFARISLLGNHTGKVFESFGASHIEKIARYSTASLEIDQTAITVIRTDFAGVKSFDLMVPQEQFGDTWNRLIQEFGATPVGNYALDASRIEHGLPIYGREITNEYLPAETAQLDRAVSFNKGCYLGQEVVARMHAHDALARVLVGIRVEGSDVPLDGMEIRAEGKAVGDLTSFCRSIKYDALIGLGYVKVAHATPGTAVELCLDDAKCSATVVALPFS